MGLLPFERDKKMAHELAKRYKYVGRYDLRFIEDIKQWKLYKAVSQTFLGIFQYREILSSQTGKQIIPVADLSLSEFHNTKGYSSRCKYSCANKIHSGPKWHPKWTEFTNSRAISFGAELS